MPAHLEGATTPYNKMAAPISSKANNKSRKGHAIKNISQIQHNDTMKGYNGSFFPEDDFFNITGDDFFNTTGDGFTDMIFSENYGMNITESNDDSSGSSAFVNFFLFFMLISCCYLSKPNVPDASQRGGLIWRERQRRREERKKDPERRKKFIDNSLITKRVIACDKNKALQLDDDSGSISISGSFSIDSSEEETSSCVICLEPFQKGDYVTWSKSMDCLHVFHKECLEGWLANPTHDDCPYCRCQIIHDVGDDDEPEEKEEDPSSLAYVIMNGLISPLRRASVSLIGSSINVDDDENSCHSIESLRRVLSFGSADVGGIMRSSSRIGLALRRVSSGITDRLRGSFDSAEEDSNAKKRQSKIKERPQLRRTHSEGLYTVTRSRSARRTFDRSNFSFDSFDERDAVELSPDVLVTDDFDSFHGEKTSGLEKGKPKKLYDTTAMCVQNLSEGMHVTPRTRNYQRLESENSEISSIDEKLHFDLEMSQNDDAHRNFPKPRLSFAFNRSKAKTNAAYTKLFSNDIDASNFIADDLSDEDSLRSFSLSRNGDDKYEPSSIV